MEKKEEKIFRDIVKILEQDVPQEALAEGNPTPEQEAIALIKQELDKAREDVLIELQKEFSEFGVPDDVRYTQPLFYINEVIEKKLSKLKTKE